MAVLGDALALASLRKCAHVLLCWSIYVSQVEGGKPFICKYYEEDCVRILLLEAISSYVSQRPSSTLLAPAQWNISDTADCF